MKKFQKKISQKQEKKSTGHVIASLAFKNFQQYRLFVPGDKRSRQSTSKKLQKLMFKNHSPLTTYLAAAVLWRRQAHRTRGYFKIKSYRRANFMAKLGERKKSFIKDSWGWDFKKRKSKGVRVLRVKKNWLALYRLSTFSKIYPKKKSKYLNIIKKNPKKSQKNLEAL